MSRASYGSVTTEIDGKKYKLELLPKVYDLIDERYGGIVDAANMAAKGNSILCTEIIAAACKIGQKDKESLKASIRKHGITDVSADVVRFLVLAMNPSGRDDDIEETQESGE